MAENVWLDMDSVIQDQLALQVALSDTTRLWSLMDLPSVAMLWTWGLVAATSLVRLLCCIRRPDSMESTTNPT